MAVGAPSRADGSFGWLRSLVSLFYRCRFGFIYSAHEMTAFQLAVWRPPLFDVGPAPAPDRRIIAASRRLDRLRRTQPLWSTAILGEVARQLAELNFAVIDNFMSETAAASDVRHEAETALEGAVTAAGLLTGGRQASGLRSDVAIWKTVGTMPSRGDTLPRALDRLADSVDALVSTLRDTCIPKGKADLAGSAAVTAAARASLELQNVHHRSHAMLATYPRNGSRYVRHLDNVCAEGFGTRCNGRRLTAVYYLNEAWASETDGGALRLFKPGLANSEPLVDLEPHLDRLTLFWADERVPHAVLPTGSRDRLAVTIWYFCDHELSITSAHGKEPPELTGIMNQTIMNQTSSMPPECQGEPPAENTHEESRGDPQAEGDLPSWGGSVRTSVPL